MNHVTFLCYLMFASNPAQSTIIDEPLLLATPYPFNATEPSKIECFTNDLNNIRLMTLVAHLIQTDQGNSLLKSIGHNLTNNGSVHLTIESPFNYSQLEPEIECHCKYYTHLRKTAKLEVLSVAVIDQKDNLTISIHSNEKVKIHCRAYGTGVEIHWDFTNDLARNPFGLLPIGIYMERQLVTNDTLIIDYASYTEHRGFYRCQATNHLLNVTYQDRRIIYLNIHKSNLWLPIVIACVLIGVCILFLILCSTYYRYRRKKKLRLKLNKVPQKTTLSNGTSNVEKSLLRKRSLFDSLSFSLEKHSIHQFKTRAARSIDQQEPIVSVTSSKNSLVSYPLFSSTSNAENEVKKQIKFILGHPFDQVYVRPIMNSDDIDSTFVLTNA